MEQLGDSTIRPSQSVPVDFGLGIEGAVFKWLVANKGRLLDAQSLNYGYEGWLQVELGLALRHAVLHDGFELHREMAIYQNSNTSKCDIWARNKSGSSHLAGFHIGVELKCESQRQKLKTDAEFQKGFADDMKRVRYKLKDSLRFIEGGHPLPIRPAAMFCFAFTTTNPATFEFDAATYYTIDASGGADHPFYLLWYRHDHPTHYIVQPSIMPSPPPKVPATNQSTHPPSTAPITLPVNGHAANQPLTGHGKGTKRKDTETPSNLN